MATPMHQSRMEPPMESQGYEARPEEYGMQPYEPRPEMGDPNDPNSPASLAAKAHHKKSKWWLYVLIVLGCLVGLVVVMGILNRVAKDGSSIAKNIFKASLYLAYASIIFTAVAAFARFAYNKIKNRSETKLQKDEKALKEANDKLKEDTDEYNELEAKKKKDGNLSEKDTKRMNELKNEIIPADNKAVKEATKKVKEDKKAEESGSDTGGTSDTGGEDNTDTGGEDGVGDASSVVPMKPVFVQAISHTK